MRNRRVALVTGASRGIGRATALGLARAGYDIVATARSTTAEAVAFDGTSQNDPDRGAMLEGGLPSLVAQIEALGVSCTPLALDLTDRASVARAAAASVDAYGRIDVLVNNAVYVGPGINDLIGSADLDLVDRVVRADAITPILLVQAALPGMLERGAGVFIHLTSGAATLTPRNPAGKGGWGLAYAIAKGGAHRMVGVLHAEFKTSGVRAYNLNPGHVLTEIGRARSARTGNDPTGQSAEVPAAAAVWLASDSAEASALAGTDVIAQDLVAAHGISLAST